MKAQAWNTQSALRTALQSPMKRQFVKLCDGVITTHPHLLASMHPFPYRSLPRQTVARASKRKEKKGLFGTWNANTGRRGHTPSCTLSPTLSFWRSSPPICTQARRNEGQPWSQLVKETNPQTLNELPSPSFLLLKRVKCTVRETDYKTNWQA